MNTNLINTVFRKEVLALSVYKVAEAKNLIKLDAMENPYRWPEDIKQDWLKLMADCPINRYPDSEAKALLATIRRGNQIPSQSGILLGNGSDEIIQILLMALPEKSCVLAPSPSFVMYRQVALSLGLNYQNTPLLADSFELDLSAMINTIQQKKPALIFLAYPNNPTANLFSEQAINTVIDAAPGLVVIDEAYAPFANASFINKLAEHSNLLVMRTVSKLGLAGLRLGFIAGNKTIIEQLNKIRLPYNINSLTQITADFALKHQDLFEQQAQQICRDRALVLEQLNKLLNIRAYPSSANFILFKTPVGQAGVIFEALKSQGILIKNLSPQGGILTDCLRVTIGETAENEKFIQALTKITESLK